MAYIFDPIQGTFIDDKDKTLGNKLMITDLVDDLEPGPLKDEMLKDFDPDQETYEEYLQRKRLGDRPFLMADGGRVNLNTGSGLPLDPMDIDNKLQEVINAFKKLSPRSQNRIGFQRFFEIYAKENFATGGRVNLQSGTNIQTLNPLFPERNVNFMSDEFQPIDVPGAVIPPLAIGAAAKRLKDIFFSKDEDEDKKDIKEEDDKLPNIEPPRIPEPLEIAEGVLTLKEIRDTFEKSKKLYDQKKMSEVVKVADKEFAQKVANTLDERYDGNVNALAKDILGVNEKTRAVENLRVRINSLFRNRGIDRGARIGNIAPSILDFETDTPKTSWSDFTTKVSQEPGYIKSLTKPLIKQGLIKKEQYLAQRDLEKVFSNEIPDTEQGKSARNNMGYIIKQLSSGGGIRKKQTGKFPRYHLGDVMKAFQLKYGEGGKKMTGVGVSDNTRRMQYKDLKSFDEGLFSILANFQDAFVKAAKIEGLTQQEIRPGLPKKEIIIDKAAPDHSHAEARSTMKKFPNVFRNSNLKTFQTITLTDPIFNQEIINKGGFEAKRIKIYRILNNYIGKKVTPESQEILIEQKNKLNNINDQILIAAKEKGLQGVEKTFVPIDINVPNVGEKFRSENIFGDTTGKDIMGKIDEINPDAKVYNDLSKEEKIVYRQNLVDEYIDYFVDFYGRTGFDEDDINSFIDRVLGGDPAGQTKPILERRVPKATGGGVNISPMPRFNFSNGGAAGADESFAKELEYYFLNEDAELPQAQSFKETMNPIEILNDMIDPRNLPYYADVLLRSGIRVGEFAARILPAAGKLASDLIRKPAFKVTGDGGNYVQDYDEVPETNIKGTGIFTEFLENITPTATEKAIGLESLIQTEEQKLKDRRSTIGPKVFADTFGLGLELTAPIFPGLKLINAYAAAKKLPKDRVTEELLNKEIDQVLAQKGMTRREFLQMSGAGATVALAKMLGIVDFFPKAGKVSRATSKMAMDTQVTGMPAWFKDAVYAIEKKGILKSRGDIKGIEPDFFEMTLNTKAGQKKVLMSKNDNTGEITIDWTTDYYDTEIPVSITYKPGESGYQNLLSDPEFPQSVERYNVEVDAPEFEYKTVDVESMGPEDTSFDSAINLDIREEADAVVEALEELGLTLTKGQKKEAAENFRYYNEVELDEGSGANTQNPLDENDVFTLMDSIKRNQK